MRKFFTGSQRCSVTWGELWILPWEGPSGANKTDPSDIPPWLSYLPQTLIHLHILMALCLADVSVLPHRCSVSQPEVTLAPPTSHFQDMSLVTLGPSSGCLVITVGVRKEGAAAPGLPALLPNTVASHACARDKGFQKHQPPMGTHCSCAPQKLTELRRLHGTSWNSLGLRKPGFQWEELEHELYGSRFIHCRTLSTQNSAWHLSLNQLTASMGVLRHRPSNSSEGSKPWQNHKFSVSNCTTIHFHRQCHCRSRAGGVAGTH
nr:uncharacterized protein LOC107033536 isoform X2 [Vicugna pacos]